MMKGKYQCVYWWVWEGIWGRDGLELSGKWCSGNKKVRGAYPFPGETI
jgi:hypothetical protein